MVVEFPYYSVSYLYLPADEKGSAQSPKHLEGDVIEELGKTEESCKNEEASSRSSELPLNSEDLQQRLDILNEKALKVDRFNAEDSNHSKISHISSDLPLTQVIYIIKLLLHFSQIPGCHFMLI